MEDASLWDCLDRIACAVVYAVRESTWGEEDDNDVVLLDLSINSVKALRESTVSKHSMYSENRCVIGMYYPYTSTVKRSQPVARESEC